MNRRKTYTRTGLTLAISLIITACSQGSSNNQNTGQISYNLVTISNPGNESDVLTGFGKVDYIYQIGKYDVTIAQYTAFLNAIAKTDTYNLYDTRMATDLNSAGINRTGAAGSYAYSVMNNGGSSANRPITYITWLEAARFANWMANGQPNGAQTTSTTENGAYNLNGATSGNAAVKNSINPNTGSTPTYSIPTYDEWYKAAYYSPELNNGSGGYYLYATESNTAPGNSIGNLPNNANNFPATTLCVTQSPDYLYATQNYLTDVGAFTASPSYYGTFDQNGNVYQWNDLDGLPTPYRGLAGGYWFAGANAMQATIYSTNAITGTDNGTGFRLASPAAQ
jgi:formylglycine-generating enzyme required for sulfatase activity